MIVTVRLRLHDPSRRKREALDRAMVRYREALRLLLERARPGAESAAGADAAAQKAFLRSSLSPEVLSELNDLGVQPMKDSLKQAFTVVLEAWFRRRQSDSAARYPRPSRSVYFCRCSPNRDFSLVYDNKKNRYYAKLHLLSAADEPFPLPETVSPKRFSVLGGGGLSLRATHRYLLAPLSFGRRQLQFLERARSGEARPLVAWLKKTGEHYDLLVGIDMPDPVFEGKPFKMLGVCRGQGPSLWYTLADAGGAVLQKGELPLGGDAPSQHAAANRIAALAAGHGAQTVLENLELRSDRLWLRGGMQELPLPPADYRALCRILAYKLPLAGARKPVLVSPARLFATCPRCGWATAKNRLTVALFLCTRCGFGGSTGEVGSLNLARRLVEYSRDKVHFAVRRSADGYVVANEELGIACAVEALDVDSIRRAIGQSLVWRDYRGKAASLYRKLVSAENLMDVVELRTE